ncbi:protein tramtrack, beta isoform isoform X3 [Anabrus simplex]|uniref:protein tramtrack, beta isoform isoform X3 n=1 Tax=Anabrus simplex TaxID=316456 RepID=UPI0035A39E7A
MALGDMEQFSLRWNNFHSNLTSGFQSLLAEEDLVDVTLAAGGGVVQAHKIILSICSPYFKQLFKVNPCKHPIVILKDVQHKDLVDILQFMYQGEVNVRQEDLGAFLKTAELLQIKGLTGQDSPTEPSSERETPVQNQSLDRIVPRIRPPRRRIDKPPQSAMPRLEKQLSPRAQSPLPPYKRMRADTPVVLSDDTSGVECIDLKSPKVEPVDCEPSAEPEPPSESSSKDGIMDETLGGESSRHSLQDSKQGLTSEPELKDPLLQQHATMSPDTRPVGLSPSVSGAASEMNTSQDGESETRFVESSRGKPQLVLDGFLYTLNTQDRTKKYWKCFEYPRRRCLGRVVTVNDTVVMERREHNHERQYDKIRQKERQAHIRRLAILNPLKCKRTLYPAPDNETSKISPRSEMA